MLINYSLKAKAIKLKKEKKKDNKFKIINVGINYKLKIT
jgi:hypothetical protein